MPRLIYLVFAVFVVGFYTTGCVEGYKGNLSGNSIDESIESRKLQQGSNENDDARCSGMCSHIQGSELKVNHVPVLHDGASSYQNFGAETNWTCEMYDSFITTKVKVDDCLDFRDGISLQCCTNLRPAYECHSLIEDKLLSLAQPKYKKDRIPLTNGSPIDTSILVDVTHFEITNHGVDGGAVDVEGSIMLQWVDERLKWDYTATDDNITNENGEVCSTTSIRVSSEDIWTPDLEYPKFDYNDEGGFKYLETNSKATVLADGRVYWIRRFIITASCETTRNGHGKSCMLRFQDHELEGSRIKYKVYDIDSVDNSMVDDGIVIHNRTLLAAYDIKAEESSISIQSDSGSSIASSIHNVMITFGFLPKEQSCNICGHGTASLVQNGTRLKLWDSTIDEFNNKLSINDTDNEDLTNISNLTCDDLNKHLEGRSVFDKVCFPARTILEEFCCQDPDPQFDCENNVHDIIMEKIGDNTVTPPDPSNADTHTLNDFVNVQVALDVHHVSGIDVKENSIEMMISLELIWYDPRLKWEPFVGGCNRASYRASLDAELTEIWVPNIQLINEIEGLDELADAHASVKYNGRVKWRRTGVVQAKCDLTGIASFPYDTPGCYLEFGGTRNPFYDRVFYNATSKVEYAEGLVDADWNYQEYKLIKEWTELTTRTEKLSGYENDVMRYQFYFERAHNYYTINFVILYIFFTYLSFGMFFVDYSLGERLGYGSAVLFTIVAQDITMAESTPVTNEFLWIYKLSFASKIYVIVALVYSIFVLWLYTRNDFGDETLIDEKETKNGGEMTDRLITDGDDNNNRKDESPNSSNNDKYVENHSPGSITMDISEPSDEGNDNQYQIDDKHQTFNNNQMESVVTSGSSSGNSSNTNNIRKRYRSLILKRPVRKTGQKFLGYNMESKNDSKRVRLIKHLRTYDLLMFIFCVVTYSIVIVALAISVARMP